MKQYTYVFAGVFALLLIITGVKVVRAELQSMCPADCRVYVSSNGDVLLTPYTTQLSFNGQTYYNQNMTESALQSVLRKQCKTGCKVYKEENGNAVLSYKSGPYNSSVVNINQSMCPTDCATYVSQNGAIILVDLVHNLALNGQVYNHVNLDNAGIAAVIRNECASSCQVYRGVDNQVITDYTVEIES